ncbi:MAG: helix-turn-helix domain-containing protein [SAR324 cluster bacterium]|nr:helix-turn-helix domain-containing protein [SAR324 cluster bacterium]
MKRKIPGIQESAEELKNILKNEKNSRKKQRVNMLYMLKSGQVKTMKEAGAILAVDRNTIGRWLAAYEQGGVPELLQIKTKPNRKLSIPADVLEELKQKLEKPGSFESYKSIWLWLKDEKQLDVKYKTVHKIVRYMLKFKIKKNKPPVRASKKRQQVE